MLQLDVPLLKHEHHEVVEAILELEDLVLQHVHPVLLLCLLKQFLLLRAIRPFLCQAVQSRLEPLQIFNTGTELFSILVKAVRHQPIALISCHIVLEGDLDGARAFLLIFYFVNSERFLLLQLEGIGDEGNHE